MIEDSTLGFNVIDRSPIDSEVDVNWIGRWRLRCSARRYRALHHNLASAAEALRQMERRFEQLNKAAVFEIFFDRLASFSSSAHVVQMFDSTVVRAACRTHLPQCDLLISG